MIDLHNHILPALDDGATNLEESLSIARTFVAEGVHTIVATPHLNPQRADTARAPAVRDAVESVRSAIESAGIALAVFPGNELLLTPEAPDLLRNGTGLPLGASHAVLVEIPLNAATPPLYLDDTLFRLQVDGYQPVLAHPERYPFVVRDPHSLDHLVERGIALQLTAPAFLGAYGRQIQRTAHVLLRRGAYTLAASDRHHPEQPRSLADLHAAISRTTDRDRADLLLIHNPAAVLDGRALAPCGPIETPRRRWWRPRSR